VAAAPLETYVFDVSVVTHNIGAQHIKTLIKQIWSMVYLNFGSNSKVLLSFFAVSP